MTLSHVAIAAGHVLQQLLTPITLRELVGAIGAGRVTRQLQSEWMHVADSGLESGSPIVASSIWRHVGVECVVGRRAFNMLSDPGKGAWSNCFEWLDDKRTSRVDHADRFLYLSIDADAAYAAREADECGNHDLLGELLGYPKCCREFFSTVWPVAAQYHGDLLPYTCAMTGSLPFDFRTNIATQYFGLSPISFFPCSFRCAAACAIGEIALDLMDRLDSNGLGYRFRQYAACSVLYTEVDGIFLLPGATLRNDRLHYQRNRVRGTTSTTDMLYILRECRDIFVESPHRLLFTMADGSQRQLAGPDVALCVF